MVYFASEQHLHVTVITPCLIYTASKYRTLYYIRLFTTKADTKKRNRTDRQRTEFTI